MDIVEEFKRLRLLENAVINYTGGLTVLRDRILIQKEKIAVVDPVTTLLLDDVATYLRDIALAGLLSLPENEHD
ncbi:TPA: hypothetical protein ROG05_004067 [Enterobacter soli]|nr:hypothetical protein [Enterobacter soli]